jgi:uncharacterized protein (DUF2235 family)
MTLETTRNAPADAAHHTQEMAMTATGASAAEPRNLIVCCDGTSNEVATESTNVLRQAGSESRRSRGPTVSSSSHRLSSSIGLRT